MRDGPFQRLLVEPLRAAAVYGIRLLNSVIPKRNQAILALYPNFDSSTPVLIEGLLRHRIAVVLVLSSPVRRDDVPAGVRTCTEGSFACLWLFLRSRWVMFTHPHFLGMTSGRQRTINLWHGMPIKAIQLLDGDTQPIPADLTIASAEVFVPILAAAFGVRRESVQVLAHPRVEPLACDKPSNALAQLGIRADAYQSVVAWMPTYRGRPTHQGGAGPTTGLLLNEDLLDQLSDLMVRHESLLLIRRHPYEAGDRHKLARNVCEVLDADLRAGRIGTYELLAEADALVSDISSIWIDYLYRDRPTLIYFPDRHDYEADRELLLAPLHDWTPSPILEAESELLAELQLIVTGDDRHADRRRSVAKRLIEASPTESVDRILTAVEHVKVSAGVSR
jgi:CDP-glycerol glycerophosphotransferase (TagB/SpsB family)